MCFAFVYRPTKKQQQQQQQQQQQCVNQMPPVQSSLASGRRASGSGKVVTDGDSTGLPSASRFKTPNPSQPSNSGGGTTRTQPGDKLPDANSCCSAKRPKLAAGSVASSQLAKRSCVSPNKLDWYPPVVHEDRLASSSRSLRHRIRQKRPPNADEGFSAKRLKLDTG